LLENYIIIIKWREGLVCILPPVFLGKEKTASPVSGINENIRNGMGF
jgi:hypothetical protein